MPADVHEEPGQGIEGAVDGHHVAVGSRAFMGGRRHPTTEIDQRRLTTTGDRVRHTSSSRSTVTSPA